VRDPFLIELTVKGVMGGIVPGHGFDHERFDGFKDSSLIWRGVHFGDVRCWWTRWAFQLIRGSRGMRKSGSRADCLSRRWEWKQVISDGREHRGGSGTPKEISVLGCSR